MTRLYLYSPDYTESILSTFDVGAVLFQNRPIDFSSGIESDMAQLSADFSKLEFDYTKASNKLRQEIGREEQCQK